MMTATEQREEILNTTKQLIAIQREHNAILNRLISLLEQEGDKLLPAAVDEREVAPHVRKVTMVPSSAPTVTTTARATPQKNANGRRRRTCSLCRQPGHWATTCPNQKG